MRGVPLAGCASREDRLAAWRDQCARDYGLSAGTEANGRCVMALQMERRRALDASFDAAIRPVPIFVPQPIR